MNSKHATATGGGAQAASDDRAILVARSIRGLEWLLAEELKSSFDAKISAIGHREVRFCAPLTRNLLDIGTADDVFMECGAIGEVPHTRDALVLLPEAVVRLPLAETLTAISRLRPLRNSLEMEVTASFLGRRNYNRYEIEDVVGEAIANKIGLSYRDHTSLLSSDVEISWRVHIRHRSAFVGLRLGEHPLHRRSYKLASRTGSLHPPVAYAMGALACLQKDMTCLDPFCGVATILIEAHSIEPNALFLGSDIDHEVLRGARANANRAGSPILLVAADAGRLPYRAKSINRIVSNVPWGTAVAPEGLVAQSQTVFREELARILAPNGRAILLCPDDEQEYPGLKVARRHRIHLFGKWVNIDTLASEGVQPPEFAFPAHRLSHTPGTHAYKQPRAVRPG
jgi:tRNA (guanine6-N2)-methyltransferase